MALTSVSEEWQVFVQSILGRDTLPMWDRMWANLQQEELRQALLKISISGSNNRSKQVKEEENVALASKGPSQGQGEQRKKKKDLSKVKCFKCGNLVTTVPNVLSGRRPKIRSMI